MESILLLVHTETDGALAKPALEALTAALELGGELTVGLVGAAVEPAANIAAAAGARRILAVTGEPFTQPRYATAAAAAVNRWFYRQRMEAVLTRTARPWLVLLDAGCFAPWSEATPQATPGTAASAAQVEFVPVEAPQSRTTVTGVQAPKADEQTIR